MDKDNVGVHQSHCCVKHGCKYDDENCPVVTGKVQQKYLCESCSDEGVKSVEQLLGVMAGVVPVCPDCGSPVKHEGGADFGIEVMDHGEGKFSVIGTIWSAPNAPRITASNQSSGSWAVYTPGIVPSGIKGAENYSKCTLAVLQKMRELQFKQSLQGK